MAAAAAAAAAGPATPAPSGGDGGADAPASGMHFTRRGTHSHHACMFCDCFTLVPACFFVAFFIYWKYSLFCAFKVPFRFRVHLSNSFTSMFHVDMCAFFLNCLIDTTNSPFGAF